MYISRHRQNFCIIDNLIYVVGHGQLLITYGNGFFSVISSLSSCDECRVRKQDLKTSRTKRLLRVYIYCVCVCVYYWLVSSGLNGFVWRLVNVSTHIVSSLKTVSESKHRDIVIGVAFARRIPNFAVSLRNVYNIILLKLIFCANKTTA